MSSPGPSDCHSFETFLRFVLPANLLGPVRTVTFPNDWVLGFYSWEASAPAAQTPALLIVTAPGTLQTPVPLLPAWLAALLVIGFATVLAIRLPRMKTRDRV